MEINGKIHYLTKLEIILKYNKLYESKYGSLSDLYKFNDKQILKIFLHNRNNENNKFELLSNLNLNNFTQPKKLVYIFNLLFGYIMDKKEGQMLDNLNENIIINDFISSIDNILKDIYLLSYNYIELVDLHDQNILYNENNKKLTILDMDEYYFDKSFLSKEELFNINTRKFYHKILEILFKLSKLDYENSLIYKIVETELNKENFYSYDLFKNIIPEIENRVNKKILTISDIRKNKNFI